jgi:uncharacterized protein DUF4136
MRNAFVAALCVAMTTTAIVYAQKVNVDSDPAAPFATYRTYAWVKGTPAPNPLSEDRLHSAVDARLAGRGLVKNGTAPDLIVVTHVTTKEQKELVVNGFGYGGWWGGGYSTASVDTSIEGTLVFDLYDAKTKKMVWRGVATATASDKPTKNVEKMTKALDKMFEKFPISTATGSSR